MSQVSFWPGEAFPSLIQLQYLGDERGAFDVNDELVRRPIVDEMMVSTEVMMTSVEEDALPARGITVSTFATGATSDRVGRWGTVMGPSISGDFTTHDVHHCAVWWTGERG